MAANYAAVHYMVVQFHVDMAMMVVVVVAFANTLHLGNADWLAVDHTGEDPADFDSIEACVRPLRTQVYRRRRSHWYPLHANIQAISKYGRDTPYLYP